MDMLDFLYHTIPGRMLLKPLTAPALSKLCGRFLDSSLSHFLVRPFIQTNNIRIEDYETDHIRSFNDFFSRKICEWLRPVDPDPKHLIAPCDGLLSVWKIEKDTVLPVKQSRATRSPRFSAATSSPAITRAVIVWYSGCASIITTATAMLIPVPKAATAVSPAFFTPFVRWPSRAVLYLPRTAANIR